MAITAGAILSAGLNRVCDGFNAHGGGGVGDGVGVGESVGVGEALG